MRKYELSISADYVPKWGIVEAAREFFQNALDEQTADSSNQMFFEYESDKQVLRIGNKHSVLETSTILLGNTNKRNNGNMIGNHGEGYKVATTVLLRLDKKVTIYNYCKKEIWRPRLVKSKKYGGILIPTFFVEDIPFWEKEPDHSLIVEIDGITQNEYEEIVNKNLNIQEELGEIKQTQYGRILFDEKYAGMVFVSGLFICRNQQIEQGVDFKPSVVRIDRDRDLVNGFDVQWYFGRMWEETKNTEQISKAADSYSGAYINYCNVPSEIREEIAEKFIDEHGAKAIPVTNEDEAQMAKKKGYKPVITTSTKRDLILKTSIFEDAKEVTEKEPVFDRLKNFIDDIEKKLSYEEQEIIEAILEEIRELIY